MAEDPSPEDESLESFYGEDADEVPGANGDGEIRAKPHAGEGRKRTLTGALMTGIALGFRQVFEPEYHDRTAVEQPAPEQPTEPQKYEIHLDPVAPESSFAIYRPWIDGEPQPEPDAEADLEPGPAAPVEKPKGGGMGALGG